MREVFIGLLMWLYGIWYSYGHTAYQLIMEVATVSALVSLLVFIIFKKQLIEELLWISHRDELAAAEHYNSPGYYDSLIESTLERTEVLIDSYPQFFY